MNKFFKKLAVVLAMTMVFAAMPMSVFAQAANTVEYNGTEYTSVNAAVEATLEAGDAAATLTVSGTVTLEASAVTSAVVDLNGVTIAGADNTATVVFKNVDGNNVGGTGSFSNFTMKNVTVVDETFYTGENGENAWEFTYLEFAGTTVFENVNFTDGIFCEGVSATFTNCTFSGHNNDSSTYGNVTMYGAWVNNGTAKFTNCTFTGTRGLKVTEIYGNADVSTVTVEGTVFDNLTEKPGIIMDGVTSNGGSNTGFTVIADNNTFNDANGLGMYAIEGSDRASLSGSDVEKVKATVNDNGEIVYFANTDAANSFAAANNATTSCWHIDRIFETVTAADCTSTGTGKYICANCGETLEENIVIAATGHAYGEWTVTTAPKCETAGVETRVCANDAAHTETREVAATGHTFASCSYDDVNHYYKCACGKTYLTGAHEDADNNAICEWCGYVIITPDVAAQITAGRANPNTGVTAEMLK